MRLKLITFYLLIVSALALVGYISYTGLNNLMTTLHEAVQPDERTEKFEQIRNYITESENNIRMYTITQDISYLIPYNQSIEELQDHIIWLYSEYANDTVLISNLNRIFDLIQEKIYVQEELIYLKRKNLRPDVFGEVLAEINSIETQINRPDTIMSIKRRPFVIDTLSRSGPPMNDPSGLQKRGFFARLFGTRDKIEDPIELPEEPVVIEKPLADEINDTITTIIDKPIEIARPIEETMNEIKKRDQYIMKMVTDSELRLTKKDDELSLQVVDAINSVNSYIQVKSIQKAGEATALYKQTTKYITIVGSVTAMLFLFLIFIVMKDFQVILKTKKELEVAKNNAENLAKVKEDFLASMSHEIRTPLNAIIGFSKHISETNLSSRDKKYFSIIKNSSQHLFEIINDILDFSKLDSGQMKIEKTPFDISKLLEETADSFRSEIDIKGLKLYLNIDNQLINRQIMGDPYRIRQILNNLIGNALKFTHEGSITIRIALEKENLLNLTIRDTGIGIPAEKIKLIFEKFAQADTSTTRKYGGTGLGLTIVKKLVGLMKGKIIVKSKVNEGTSFMVSIPTSLVKPKSVKAEVPPIEYHDLSNITCLITDDDNYNLMLLEKSLKDYYIKVFSVTSGKEALEYIGQITFDLIILDLQMPEMDGYETAMKLRARDFNKPILALSAFVNNEVLKKCKESGIDQVISKPFNEKELIMTIIHKHGIAKKTFRLSDGHKIHQEPDKMKSTEKTNLEFRDKMIQIYINNLEEFLHVTNVSSVENSFDAIQYAAHKLVPSSRHMGFQELVVLLKKTEDYKLNGHNAEDASDLVNRIRDIVSQVKKDLTAQFSNVT
jgi:signal transduction histidine kinase/CheY-like chemotaxis protein/HPt (histidine-containing phosphotransfer) domain-containing protein